MVITYIVNYCVVMQEIMSLDMKNILIMILLFCKLTYLWGKKIKFIMASVPCFCGHLWATISK